MEEGILMFCQNCGNEIGDSSRFCKYCGAETIDPMSEEETSNEDCADVNSTDETAVEDAVAPKQKKKGVKIALISSIVAVALVVVALVTMLIVGSFSKMTDEEVQVAIEDVIKEINDGDLESAKKLFEKIKLEKDSEYGMLYDEIEEIIDANPQLVNVDMSDYPNVTVEIQCENGIQYEKEDFAVEYKDDSENPFSIVDFSNDNGSYKITFAENTTTGGVDVDGYLKFVRYKEFNFKLLFAYTTQDVKDAFIELITSNVETYPEISLYFKVEDENGDTIENLDKKCFRIKEYLDVDDFLERDVIYAEKLDGKYALNVSLAIDKSDSISDDDMVKIKNATNTFLSNLQFSSGDKAEIVAFDSNVMQMCVFTNNRDYLTNGVNSMYPDGLTACYDAIVKSIHNASVQNGARCVIAFTDGMDNESVSTAYDVINLANEKSVPVYIIGVGPYTETSTLRNIAESTGGTYHHIDDVESMNSIYNEIYREQKNMYIVKYKSDSSIPQDSERRIIAEIRGKSYMGICDEIYTPVIPVTVAPHSSRYEVIQKDITWEEANRECVLKGGHLATITSKEEEKKIIAKAEATGLERLWIGGYTTVGYNDFITGHWVTGEQWGYENWYTDGVNTEPSRTDANGDNADEFYLMLWKIDNVWSWNDQRNDLINSLYAETYKGKMGYVIEYED